MLLFPSLDEAMVSKVGLINNVQFKYVSIKIYGHTSKKNLSEINWPSVQKITCCWKLRKVDENIFGILSL